MLIDVKAVSLWTFSQFLDFEKLLERNVAFASSGRSSLSKIYLEEFRAHT